MADAGRETWITGVGIVSCLGEGPEAHWQALLGSSPKPDTIKAGVEESCYRDGYKGKAKSKNLVSSLIGGLVGTVVWGVIYFSNNSE